MRPAASGGLFPGGPHCSCGSWEVFGSLHWAPLAVGPLPDPPALLCLLSAGCLLGLETFLRVRLRPLPDDSLGGLVLPERLLWSSLRQRVGESSSLCLVLPLRGSVTFLAFVPQLEALSESLIVSIPRSFLVMALSASAVGFADAL